VELPAAHSRIKFFGLSRHSVTRNYLSPGQNVTSVDEAEPPSSYRTIQEHEHARMRPLYLARIEDLDRGDLLKVDCAACHHVALLTPEALLRVGLSPSAKVLSLQGRLRCRGCGRKGRAVVSIEWARGKK
jgi:hypothetical protein